MESLINTCVLKKNCRNWSVTKFLIDLVNTVKKERYCGNRYRVNRPLLVLF